MKLKSIIVVLMFILALTACSSDGDSAETGNTTSEPSAAENSTTGNPLVHYQVKIPDKTLPTSTDYSLSGAGFANSVINNGGEDTTFILSFKLSHKF